MAAGRLLQFLEASQHLRCQKNVRKAVTSFKPLILKDGFPTHFVQTDEANPETLRKARVHLDLSAMVAFRMYWRDFVQLDALWVYLFVDASPQVRGLELYAATFDILFNTATPYYHRRLFPQIHIGRDCYSLVGKTSALLWLIFLQVGPFFADIRNFCNSVAGITSDMGTEKGLADYKDILIPFCKALQINIPRNAIAQEYLFPHALCTIGWMHAPPPHTYQIQTRYPP